MKNYVVDSYEHYQEENRLTTNNARRIEFLNTIRIMNELIPSHSKILDCAAGTGIYSFALADQGHSLTATDITPRHVEYINTALSNKHYSMDTAVLDATDMSCFTDNSFDVVLNMGPFYHLLTNEQREKCLLESLRVLKKGGLLFTAYIPRHFIFQRIALSNPRYLDASLATQLLETGVSNHDDPKCFWTDTYYATKKEMEQLYLSHHLSLKDHFAQDGLTPQFAQTVDSWTDEQFEIWCNYHYQVCREESILGASNHVIIVGQK